MPLTPFHLFPAGVVYFLFYRRLHGFAFFLAAVLIDFEPIIFWFLGFPAGSVPLLFGDYASFGLHVLIHNPFGIFFVLAPLIAVLARGLEFQKSFWLLFFPDAEWVGYSWKQTYFSAVLGGIIHLGWDFTMHRDINLGFPFVHVSNPFVNSQAMIWIGVLSFVLILPAYFVGRKINGGDPFRKLP